MRATDNNGSIMGVNICIGALKLNHLLFTDDNIIFCKACVTTSRRIQLLLKRYELASSQKINSYKTVIVFTNNTTEEVRVQLCECSMLKATSSMKNILCLPPVIGK